MPIEPVTARSAEQRMALLDEAVRRILASVSGASDSNTLRRKLIAAMDEGATSLSALMRVGRRWAVRSVGRRAYNERTRASGADTDPGATGTLTRQGKPIC